MLNITSLMHHNFTSRNPFYKTSFSFSFATLHSRCADAASVANPSHASYTASQELCKTLYTACHAVLITRGPSQPIVAHQMSVSRSHSGGSLPVSFFASKSSKCRRISGESAHNGYVLSTAFNSYQCAWLYVIAHPCCCHHAGASRR